MESWDRRQAGEEEEADQKAISGRGKGKEKESREVGQPRSKANTWAALNPQGQGGRCWSLGRTGSHSSLSTARTGWASGGAGSERQGPLRGGGGAAN